MKKSKILSSIVSSFAFMIIFVNCAKSQVKEPEQIGKQSFNIIKTLPSINLEKYQAALMSFEQLQSFKEVSPDGFENFLAQVTSEEMKKDHQKSYDKFQALVTADDEGWKNIKFSEFTYTLDSIDGISICDGRLTVRSGETNYTIKTSSIFNGEEYFLAGMKPLNDKK